MPAAGSTSNKAAPLNDELASDSPTGEQNVDLQTDVLKEEGCEGIFTDELREATA